MKEFVLTEAKTRVDFLGEVRVTSLVSRRVVTAEALPFLLQGYCFPKRAMASDYMHHGSTMVRWDERKS